MSHLDALFGRVFNDGTELELEGGLNFEPPLVATHNAEEERIDISIDGNGALEAGTEEGQILQWDGDSWELVPFNEAGSTSHVVYLSFEDGATIHTELQAAIDAAPEYATIFLNCAGTFYIQRPIRLHNKITLRGLGKSTILKVQDIWAGGPSIMIGAERDALPHGAAILDDADFSYEFIGANEYYLNLGRYGVYPTGLSQLWFEMPMVFLEAPDSTVFTVCGGRLGLATNVAHSYAFALEWDPSLTKLRVEVRIGGVLKTLDSTSTWAGKFSDGLRHMVAVGYDGSTVRLFIDGVLEASTAATGTFTTKPWEQWVIGGFESIRFPSGQLFLGCTDFRCGGVRIMQTNQQTANYSVNWNKPTSSATHDIAILYCETAREVDDLIKLSIRGNSYAWMQVDKDGDVGLETIDVCLSDLKLSGGVIAQGIGVHVFASMNTRLERLEIGTGHATFGVGNSYYSTLKDIDYVATGTGTPRFGIHWNGGVSTIDRISAAGAAVTLALSGGGVLGRAHVYGYTHVGALLDNYGGDINSLGVSDEGTSLGVDPLYGVYLVTFEAYPAGLEVNSLTVDVLSSDTSVPVAIEGSSQVLRFGHIGGLHSGHTTPPAQLIKFVTPTLTPTIKANFSGTITLSDYPEKVLSDFGPVAAKALTDASSTYNHRDAAEVEYSSAVTLTADRTLTLDDANSPAEGAHVRVKFAAAGLKTLKVLNHDTTELFQFVGGHLAWAEFRFDGADWALTAWQKEQSQPDYVWSGDSTNNTATDRLTVAVADNTITRVGVSVIGEDQTDATTYVRVWTMVLKRSGGSVTQLGSDQEAVDDASGAWGAAIAQLNATSFDVNLAGHASHTVAWKIEVFVNTTGI
jgi:hypothetical protein